MSSGKWRPFCLSLNGSIFITLQAVLTFFHTSSDDIVLLWKTSGFDQWSSICWRRALACLPFGALWVHIPVVARDRDQQDHPSLQFLTRLTNAPGAHFTKNLWAQNQNLARIFLALMWIIHIRPDCNFIHAGDAITGMLSLDSQQVQIYELIRSSSITQIRLNVTIDLYS